MTVAVRPVNLDSEEQELLELLQTNLRDLPHARRFNWLYRNNPAGAAWSWFAYEKETKTPIGVASVFPRVMWVGKEIRLCGQVGDFAIDIGHRSLGPALMLQRATFEPVNQGMLGLIYDCPPDDRGMSTFRRLGIEPHCQMLRYAKLLRTDREFAKRLGSGKLAAEAALIGNRWLKMCSRPKPTPAAIEIALHTARCGEEFSFLDQQVGGADVIRSRRTAADLNWRYKDDPLHEYKIMTARRRGELVAYIVFSTIEQDAYVIDLFGWLSLDVALPLLRSTVEHLRDRPIQTVQAQLVNGSALTTTLKEAGFRYRSQAARIVPYTGPDGEVCAFLATRPRWFFNHADVLA